jgi:hypothetical protein
MHITRFFGCGKSIGGDANPGEYLIAEGCAVSFGHPFIQVFLNLAAIQYFQEGDKDRVIVDE